LQLVRKVVSRDTVDWHATALDLTVILAVAVTADRRRRPIAALIGVGVAVVLFVLRMSRSIVRRERYGGQARSRRGAMPGIRLLTEHAVASCCSSSRGRLLRLGRNRSPSASMLRSPPGCGTWCWISGASTTWTAPAARILLQTHERLKAQGAHMRSLRSTPRRMSTSCFAAWGVVAAAGTAFADPTTRLEWAENHLVGTLRPAKRQAANTRSSGSAARAASRPGREQFRRCSRGASTQPARSCSREGAAEDGLYIT